MTEVVQASSSIFGGITRFMWMYGSWVFTFLLICVIVVGTLDETIRTQSAIPIIRELGSRIASPDHKLYQDVNRVINKEYIIKADNQKILFNRIKFQIQKYYIFFEIFVSLWFMYIMGKVIFTLWDYLNAQYTSQSFMLTILTMMTLEILYSSLDFIISHASTTLPDLPILMKDVLWIFIPFKGLFVLILYSPTLINTIIEIQPVNIINTAPLSNGTLGGITNETISKIGDKIINTTISIVGGSNE